MKILHVIMSVNPADGGPVEGVRQLGTALTATGENQVEVVTVDGPNASFLVEFPLPVHPLGPRYTWYGYAPGLVPWLRANASRFDVVVVNGLWRYPAFATWRALHATATPYVVFTHGMLDPWFKREYPLKHLKKWLYWPWADYRVLRDAASGAIHLRRRAIACPPVLQPVLGARGGGRVRHLAASCARRG